MRSWPKTNLGGAKRNRIFTIRRRLKFTVETPRASPWHLKPIQASLDLNPEFFAIVRILICSFHPGL